MPEPQTPSNAKAKQLALGICLMLLSALTTCTAQLLLKLANTQSSLLYLVSGLGLYGVGAILMILAFRYGETSVLHPMLSVGYIGSLFIGALFLNEIITLQKVVGIALVLMGLIFMTAGGLEKKK